jgi:hypothetical protein
MSSVSSIETIRNTFETQRYVKLDGLIEDGLRRMLYDHAQRRAPVGVPSESPDRKGSVDLFGDELMEFLLGSLHARVEELSGVKLHPTYSFLRIYRRGNLLRRHTDRSSCEVSVSLNLGPRHADPWPLWIRGPQGASAVRMEPGDAVLYRGIECEHWREPLEEEQVTQVFLHYVEQRGRYSEWKFDKRPSLGI